MLVGLIGKPNTGKSTFFSAATMKSVPIADFPFTTIKPNIGMAYLRTKCVHEELGVIDKPRNSVCVNGTRLIPVKLVDVAGLVAGASGGRGLGNQFLSEMMQADALVHVVDASGSTDEEGRKVAPGSHDPTEDVKMVERELDLWILGIIKKDWEKAAKLSEQTKSSVVAMLAQRLAGLGVGEVVIEEVLLKLRLKADRPTEWGDSGLEAFVKALRELTKPSLIAANKADLPASSANIEKLRGLGKTVVPSAAEAELLLRKAAEAHIVSYAPGDSTFSLVKRPEEITPAQAKALGLVNDVVLKRYGNTGVQQSIDQAYFGLLKAIVVYPVEDETKFADKNGNVLPDAYVMNGGSTALDLARKIHSDLAETFLYAVDARKGLRLSSDYVLKDRDVVKIVSSGRHG
ncbi:MAG: redox-regulated ATPase YchF [Thaumarchaeota archaeon]|nr:redox-regulated ATPase YchF [Nitrososphaerota archaeon]